MVRKIDVAVANDGGQWCFRFVVEEASGLFLPAPGQAGRADALWKSTCFEAFVATDGAAYLEFNFSPSGQWAAYRFDGYRIGLREEAADVDVAFDRSADMVALEAKVTCDALVAGAALGLSAVVESRGTKSYWALAHPAGPPDFHDPSCFVARLPE